jgi:hypothetical protein
LFKELIGCQRSCWLPPEIQSNSGSCLPLVFPPGGLVQRWTLHFQGVTGPNMSLGLGKIIDHLYDCVYITSLSHCKMYFLLWVSAKNFD